MSVKAIPDGFHSITPYLGIQHAADAIEFYKRAFGATELFRLLAPNGDIGHAEIRIGDSSIMLGATEKGLGGCMIASIGRPALRETLDIPDQAREALIALTPGSYTGNAEKQARDI